jgi:type IV pilus assembly protein PilC
MSLKEEIHFVSRLSFLLKADVPLASALEIIYSQTKAKNKNKKKNTRKQKVIKSIQESVSAGQFLSEAISNSGGKMSTTTMHIVRVAEKAGTLPESLEYAGQELLKKASLKSKIIGACIYPFCIGFATLGLSLMIILYVLPKISPVFISLNIKLPVTTRILLALAEAMTQHYVLIILILVGVSIAGFVLIKKFIIVRTILEFVILKVPLVGSMILNYENSKIWRTFGMLLNVGLSYVDAFALAMDGSALTLVKDKISPIKESILRGERLSVLIAQNKKVFPDMASDLLYVGESSGSVSQVALKLGEYFESELDSKIKALSSMLEPLLMIVMGLIVGLIAVSVIAPIYEITSSIKK